MKKGTNIVLLLAVAAITHAASRRQCFLRNYEPKMCIHRAVSFAGDSHFGERRTGPGCRDIEKMFRRMANALNLQVRR
jgi:hypothetical protein